MGAVSGWYKSRSSLFGKATEALASVSILSFPARLADSRAVFPFYQGETGPMRGGAILGSDLSACQVASRCVCSDAHGLGKVVSQIRGRP